RNVHSGHGCDFLGPWASRIDYHVSPDGFYLACPIILDLHARHALARTDEIGHFSVPADNSAMHAGCCQESQAKAERLKHTIGDLYSSKCLGIEKRFDL